MKKVDFNKIGMTEKQLIVKYGEKTTMRILNSRIFIGSTRALNENKEQVYYYIDIEHALKEIKGIYTGYFD